jgi:large subunit ribosomal protein L20
MQSRPSAVVCEKESQPEKADVQQHDKPAGHQVTPDALPATGAWASKLSIRGSFDENHLWLRSAKETIVRAETFAFRDRRARKREFRKLWIIRINAACRERGMRYSEFIAGLVKAKITLDRKSLSEIAIADPAAFDVIVAQAKAALAA